MGVACGCYDSRAGRPGRKRMGGRAVEGTGLENRQGCKLLVGSNPTPSAAPPFLAVSGYPDSKHKPRETLPFQSSVVSRRIVLSQHRWGNEVGNGMDLPPFRSRMAEAETMARTGKLSAVEVTKAKGPAVL